jgi:hypothetical protein
MQISINQREMEAIATVATKTSISTVGIIEIAVI